MNHLMAMDSETKRGRGRERESKYKVVVCSLHSPHITQILSIIKINEKKNKFSSSHNLFYACSFSVSFLCTHISMEYFLLVVVAVCVFLSLLVMSCCFLRSYATVMLMLLLLFFMYSLDISISMHSC